MSERQYIGARYVPTFADPVEWDSLRSYEPLTIVTYLNNSYTSKKPVPAGTDLNNSDYWVLTGNYNAQIQDFNNRILKCLHTYENVNAMQSDTTLTIGTIAYTQGYYIPGDGGEAYYIITGTAPAGSYITTANGYGELVIQDYVTPVMFGAKGDGVTDDTAAVKAAAAANKTVYFPAGNYKVVFTAASERMINCVNGQHIILDNNAHITVAPNNYDHYYVFYAENVSNVIIEGGNIHGDKIDHTYTAGSTHEFCHAVCVGGNTDSVTIKNIRIDNMPGDGVSIGGDTNFTGCKNIKVQGLTIDGCRRQGVSVCEGENVIVSGNTIKNIEGTAPMSAVNVEPFLANRKISGILVTDNVIENCLRGYMLAVPVSNTEVGVIFSNTTMKALRGRVIDISGGTDTTVTGRVGVYNIYSDYCISSPVKITDHISNSYWIDIDNVLVDEAHMAAGTNQWDSCLIAVYENRYSGSDPLGGISCKNVSAKAGNYGRYSFLGYQIPLSNIDIHIPDLLYTDGGDNQATVACIITAGNCNVIDPTNKITLAGTYASSLSHWVMSNPT